MDEVEGAVTDAWQSKGQLPTVRPQLQTSTIFNFPPISCPFLVQSDAAVVIHIIVKILREQPVSFAKCLLLATLVCFLVYDRL